jgi:hypothetical protein
MKNEEFLCFFILYFLLCVDQQQQYKNIQQYNKCLKINIKSQKHSLKALKLWFAWCSMSKFKIIFLFSFAIDFFSLLNWDSNWVITLLRLVFTRSSFMLQNFSFFSFFSLIFPHFEYVTRLPSFMPCKILSLITYSMPSMWVNLAIKYLSLLERREFLIIFLHFLSSFLVDCFV